MSKKLAAVIVETRAIPNLVEIIRDRHMNFLPDDVQLIIFHSDENYEMLKEAFPNAGFSSVNGLRNLDQYNWLLTQPKFWEQLQEYLRVLIFQTDSRLLRTGIEAFYEYDYVGASWNFEPLCCNGGISLRNPKVMLEICQKFRRPAHMNEDIFFSQMLKDNPELGKIATQEAGDLFSTETRFRLNTLASHGVEKWLSPEECNRIYTQYE